jgi:diaminopimelate epimerase
MHFTKMHGIGNDYVYVNCFKEPLPADPAALAVKIADRHYGVGGDGLILICPSERGDARMRMFNADGSESEMCGNGVRCVAKYVYDHGIARKPVLNIETGNGVLPIALEIENGKVSRARVDMGPPVLELEKIPVDSKFVQKSLQRHFYDIPDVLDYVDQKGSIPAVFVSMGNPHAVIFSMPAEDDHLELGARIEKHRAFPKRINVHFVQVHSPGEITMRTWERGSGITLACGTGASAVCVAGVLTGRTDRKILAHLPGGDLELEWADDNHVYMTGPATEVFTGEWLEAQEGGSRKAEAGS